MDALDTELVLRQGGEFYDPQSILEVWKSTFLRKFKTTSTTLSGLALNLYSSVYLLFVVPERICVTKLVLLVQLQ